MELQHLIDFLKNRDPETRVAFGFGEADSYRGDYRQMAFEPRANTTVGDMLTCAQNADGAIFQGYKGGYYTMDLTCDVYIAEYGKSGQLISEVMLMYMVGEQPNLNDWNNYPWF